MKIKAKIVDYRNGQAYLETIPEGQCVGCKGCSQASVRELMVISPPVEIGRDVWLSMETKDVTKAAFMAYGLPLLLFMAGLFSGIALFTNSRYDSISELIGLGIGIFLFLTTYLLLRRGEIKRDEDQLYQAKIIGYTEEEIWNH